MRKGAKRVDWTTNEIAYLISSAGERPRREICQRLKRSKRSVESKVYELRKQGIDITLRCFETQLVWCTECATWRTSLDLKTGRCRVCAMREQLRGREEACADTLNLMSLKQRLIYEESEAKRLSRKLPKRPRKIVNYPMSAYERKQSEKTWLIELEQWEYYCLKLQYDAAKTRLRRMREKVGTNPRKHLK